MREEGEAVAVVECPYCAAPTRPGARFCRRCGQSLQRPSASFGDNDPFLEKASSLVHRQTSASPSERVRANWSDIKTIIWFFVLLLMSSLVLGLAARSGPTLALEVAITGFDAMVIVLFVILRSEDVTAYLRVRVPSLRRIAENIAAVVLFFGVVEAYFAAMDKLGVPSVRLTDDYVAAKWPIWAMFALVSASPGIFEELAFRGVIQGVLGRVLSVRRDALVVQAALFSVLHLSPVIFPSHFFMGLVLGWMRDRNRTLYPGMLLHAAWNAYVVYGELAVRCKGFSLFHYCATMLS